MSSKRNAKTIAAEIAATRENLVKTVAKLDSYVKPMNLVTRGLGLGGSFFVTEKGNLKVERVIAAVAGGLGLVGLFSRSRKN